jgi:hypothetical protein
MYIISYIILTYRLPGSFILRYGELVYKIRFVVILTYVDIVFKVQEHLMMAGSNQNMLWSDIIKYTEFLRVGRLIKYIYFIKG